VGGQSAWRGAVVALACRVLIVNTLRVVPLILLLALVGCEKNSGESTPPQEEPVACTMDAKVCPDGSAVGREGPNCEFPPCPGETPAAPQPE
jgi:hypothetical protein